MNCACNGRGGSSLYCCADFCEDHANLLRPRHAPFAKIRQNPKIQHDQPSSHAHTPFCPNIACRLTCNVKLIATPSCTYHPRPSSTDKSTKSVGSAKMHVLCRSHYRQDTDDEKDEAVHISQPAILPKDNPPPAVKNLPSLRLFWVGTERGLGLWSRDK